MGKSNLRKSNHIMKKTLTAVAVLGALSGAAMATEGTLYGVLDRGFKYQHTEGGDDSFAMTSGNYAGPRFGFKGTEDLGDNLTLGFVLEAGFNSSSTFNRVFYQSEKMSPSEFRISHAKFKN